MGEFPYVGRDGQPISREEAYAAFEDPEARTVRQEHINGHFVSTVWLVIDHGHDGVPVPFETQIFCEHDGGCALDQWCERATTEDGALALHDQAMAAARDFALV